MLLPDLVSLMIFVRAVEARSLSKAAAQSHIALAAASRRVAILEARYGVALLERSARGVAPTPAGLALFRQARAMLLQAGEAEALLSDYARGARGHVRLEANTSAITQTLPADLAAFAALAPDVRFDLEESRSVDIVRALREGRIHIGIVMEGCGTGGLTCYPYRTDTLAVVVPARHPLRTRSASFARVLRYDLIGLDASAAMTQLLHDAALELGRPLRLRMQVRSFEAVCRLVQAGMGIGVLPREAVAHLIDAMGLRLVALSDPWAKRRMAVCVRDPATLPQDARALVAHLTSLPSQDAKTRLIT